MNINNIDEFAKRINVSIKELNYFARYQNDNVRKVKENKNNKERIFYKPSINYKILLRKIDKEIKLVKLPKYYYGSPKGISCIDSARVHKNSPYILKLDLKNFYPNIHYTHVNKAISHFIKDDATVKLITKLCTIENHLPQGFPTSPSIAENVLIILATRLKGLCDVYDLKISVYIDDITISGSRILSKLESKILKIFKEMNFVLNLNKKEFVANKHGTKITGVYIKNNSASIDPIRESELIEFITNYKNTYINKKKLKKSLIGKLNYINQIDPIKAKHYRKIAGLI